MLLSSQESFLAVGKNMIEIERILVAMSRSNFAILNSFTPLCPSRRSLDPNV